MYPFLGAWGQMILLVHSCFHDHHLKPMLPVAFLKGTFEPLILVIAERSISIEIIVLNQVTVSEYLSGTDSENDTAIQY